jgi:hypothetical protein
LAPGITQASNVQKNKRNEKYIETVFIYLFIGDINQLHGSERCRQFSEKADR